MNLENGKLLEAALVSSALKSEMQAQLLEAEGRLIESEEIAWHAKAEASELLFAFEQEQENTKKMTDEIDNLREESKTTGNTYIFVYVYIFINEFIYI